MNMSHHRVIWWTAVLSILAIAASGPFSTAFAKLEKPKGYPERNVEVIVGWQEG